MSSGRGTTPQAARRRWRWLLTLMLIGLAVTSSPARPAAAAGCTVTNTNDDAAGSLRECLSSAAAGDTITIGITGTIVLTSTLNIGKNLTIVGPGANNLAISGNNAVRVFDTEGRTVTIDGVTIRDGKVTDSSGGGGIRNSNGGKLTLTNSVVTANSSGYDGGGIYNSFRATLTVSGTTISGNTANRGGGIGTDTESTVTLNTSTISNNTADGRFGSLDVGGGGIYVRENSNLTITNSTISNNVTTRGGRGGGIWGSAATVSSTGSTISGNTATTISGNGGGIYHTSSNSASNPLTITNSTISGNSAYGVGGLDASGPTSIRFTTVTNNTSTQARNQQGNIGAIGGISVSSNKPLEFMANIVIGNTSTAGNTNKDCSGLTSSGYNVVGTGTGCPSGSTGDATASDAASVLVTTLANNGGSTQTHALVIGSPAVDRVPTGSCTMANSLDQRGAARSVGTACDSGAYEGAVAGPTPSPSPSPSPSGPPISFVDVPADYWAHDQIIAFARRGITTGCGPGEFCPERPVTRAEMAAFLIRAITGQTAAPAGPATPTFADVPPTHPQYGYIEALVKLGITTGCGGTEYCPDRKVTRAEMAAFIIRAKTGQTAPPAGPATATFADVPVGHPQYGFIEEMAARLITTGCGDPNDRPRNYCPGSDVTRAEMAVFIIRAYP